MILQRHLERLTANDMSRVGASCYSIIAVIWVLRDIVVHSSLKAIVATVVKGKRRGTHLTWIVKLVAVEIFDLSFSYWVRLIQRHGLVKETLRSCWVAVAYQLIPLPNLTVLWSLSLILTAPSTPTWLSSLRKLFLFLLHVWAKSTLLGLL